MIFGNLTLSWNLLPMMNKFPIQPGDEQGPVFNQPWEAQAFSLVIALHHNGVFTWQEWSTTLAEVIAEAQAGGDADPGNTYYQHWLKALELLVAEKALSHSSELSNRIEQWRSAYLRTPHGQPVELNSE